MKLSASIIFIIALSSLQSSASPFAFDDALAKILSRNTSIESNEASLEYTKANALPSKFIFAPSISLDAKSYQTGNHGTSSNIYSLAEATSRYNLFHWGADLANLKAANSDIASQSATLESAKLNAEDVAVNALVLEIQKKKEIEINQSIADIQTKLYKVAQERFKSGYLASQEVDKISVDLENANASLSDAELQETAARAQLENLLGSSDVELEWPWKARMEKSGEKLTNEKWNVSELPEWQAAHRHLEAEEQRHTKLERLLLPSVDLSFSYGFYHGVDSYGYPATSWIPGWNAALGITLPFFDNMVSYSNMKAQAYTEKVADVALVQQERDAKAAWDTSLQSFKIALKAAKARESTLAISRKLYQDSLRRFQAGRITANDLVIDQRRLLDSELFAVQGWANAHLQFPKLCHSLGKKLEQCWN